MAHSVSVGGLFIFPATKSRFDSASATSLRVQANEAHPRIQVWSAPCRVLCPTRRTWLHNPAKFTMQTIEEYKAYTKQLENEVGKWHHAYDALMVERNQLARELATWKKIADDLEQARILDKQQRGKK